MKRLRTFLSRHRSLDIVARLAVIGVVLPLLAATPVFGAFQPFDGWLTGFSNAAIFVMLAIGLNVVVGKAGLLDLGFAAFFAIGAYTYAFGASAYSGNDIPFWLMLPIGAVITAIFGVAIGAPTLRLRGDYLAIVTLGFGEIIPNILLNSDRFTLGTNGISGLYRPELPFIGTFKSTEPWPWFVLALVLVAIIMIAADRISFSRIGRAWEAIREDELAASSNGINTITFKLLAFAIGASTAGIAGAFLASKLSFVSPDQFKFAVSVTVLAMLVLGGIGNLWGAAIGAFLLYFVQSILLKQLNEGFKGVPVLGEIDFLQLQYLLFGLALVVMMLRRPGGLFPERRAVRNRKGSESS
ncbi:MAG: branched-chain amino acid ABC transporter permease [Candidatus Limnocylindrus sp.]